MKPFYKVDIDECDVLSVLTVEEPPDPIREDFERFKLRCEQAVERVRRQVDEGPARTNFLITRLLRIARLGLQDGNLEDANNQLNRYDARDYLSRYYNVRLEKNGVFFGDLYPWIHLPMPKEVTAFMNRIERTFVKVVRLIEPARKPEEEIKGKLKIYLDELLGIAFLGLEKGDIEAATSALDGFESRFVENESASAHNKYIVSTLKTTSIIFAITFYISLLSLVSDWYISETIHSFFERFRLNANSLPTLLSLIIGICLGMSFFALVRAPNLTFDSIEHFDPGDLHSWLRFALVSMVSLITCILLSAGVFKFEVAGLKLEGFADNRLTAVILGIMCGYSDVAITRALTGVLGQKS